MKKFAWRVGDRAKVARSLKVQAHHLTEIFNRSRGVGPRRAKALEAAFKRFGYYIPWEAFLFNAETKHPAFAAKRR